ncbi:kinase domain-containing protein [Sclerotinia borealis F-4128]|uniref:Kinase domain-containing protein n=1 Tax=Sclerotinia borealis (strain F-4128) TaxID=1432307 RepID=W9CC88_SCLBF|nr:kinase domain-containing protein [Sclerotinia borealis F-4128]
MSTEEDLREQLRRALEEVEEAKRDCEIATQQAHDAEKHALEIAEQDREIAERQADDAAKQAEIAKQRFDDTLKHALEIAERQAVANRQADDAKKRADIAEQHEQKTTLAEYLDLCHTHIFRSISVQTKKPLTTQGGVTSPKGKLRPNRLRPWIDFLSTQQHTQEQLQLIYTDHNKKRSFGSSSFMKGLGDRVALIKIATERDLAYIQSEIIEEPVALIIGHLKSLHSVRSEFNIGDGIFFDNNPNTLSDTEVEVSQRLKNLEPVTPNHSTPSFSGLQADQRCVYTTVEDGNTLRNLAFVVEHKAPHKLNLASLRFGLREMDIKSVIDSSPPATPAKVKGIDNPELFQYHADRLVASAITQTFSYMIQAGMQYAYITTGIAFVFLHIRLDDPGTIYYYLVEPGNDVLAQKEAGQKFVHRTAASQVLAFTLLALESEAGNQKWIEDAINMLDIWKVDYEAILHEIPDSVRTAPPSSEYRPKTYVPAEQFTMDLRNKSANSTCRPYTSSIDKDDPESPDAYDHESPDTPTRSTKRHNQSRKDGSKNANTSGDEAQRRSFCTQRCLLGLAERGNLDTSCPNILDHYKTNHRSNQHQLNRETFLSLLHQQLEQNRDDDCYPLGIQGARGALFKITLTSHGYTVVAKGTVRAFAKDLRHECKIYEHLKKIQGVYIPICFGSINLIHPYHYDIGVQIVHMMILSWAGERWDKCKVVKEMSQECVNTMVMQTIQQIHHAGILHRDLRAPNVFWNAEMKRVMLIDFERSEIIQAVSSEKSDDSSIMLKSQVRDRFEDELSVAEWNLTRR